MESVFRKHWCEKRHHKSVEQYYNTTVIQKVERSAGTLNLLYLGVIGQRKGIYDILKALKDNKERFEGKVALRIGGNQEEEKLLACIKEFGLQNIVKFGRICFWRKENRMS